MEKAEQGKKGRQGEKRGGPRYGCLVTRPYGPPGFVRPVEPFYCDILDKVLPADCRRHEPGIFPPRCYRSPVGGLELEEVLCLAAARFEQATGKQPGELTFAEWREGLLWVGGATPEELEAEMVLWGLAQQG